MATLSGLHATTPQHLQLDAGVLLANINTSPSQELEKLLSNYKREEADAKKRRFEHTTV